MIHSISVPKGNREAIAIPIEHLFLQFSKAEKLHEENMLDCPRCVGETNGEKKVDLVKSFMPELMVIHLKRFAFDANNTITAKIEQRVSYPITALNLSLYCVGEVTTPVGMEQVAPPIYDLVAIVQHIGASKKLGKTDKAKLNTPTESDSAGHYKAEVKCTTDGKWRCFDDDRVYTIESPTTDDPQAYMLFYQKQKVAALATAGSAKQEVEDKTTSEISESY